MCFILAPDSICEPIHGLVGILEIERFLGGGISPCKDVVCQFGPCGEILFCNNGSVGVQNFSW